MSPSEISLHTPRTVAEAGKLLRKHEGALLLAGGTDVLIDLRAGLLQAGHLICLEGINELKKIRKKDGTIRIGAMVTCQEIASDRAIGRYLPSLAEAAKSMASFQIRLLATIGGNIARAVPSADLPPPLIAANASVRLKSPDTAREVPLLEFFQGPKATIRRTDEILTSIVFPLPPPHTGSSYQRFGLRETNALAVAAAAVSMTLENGKIEKAAIVLGAVAPTPLFAVNASESLLGKEPSTQVFEQAALMARDESKPISDVRGSVWYRKELVYTLTLRALSEAFSRAQGELKRVKGKQAGRDVH